MQAGETSLFKIGSFMSFLNFFFFFPMIDDSCMGESLKKTQKKQDLETVEKKM